MNDTTWKVKKHVFGKVVRQMRIQGPQCREGAPSLIIEAFLSALSRMRIRLRCPMFKVPLPEDHDRKTD